MSQPTEALWATKPPSLALICMMHDTCAMLVHVFRNKRTMIAECNLREEPVHVSRKDFVHAPISYSVMDNIQGHSQVSCKAAKNFASFFPDLVKNSSPKTTSWSFIPTNSPQGSDLASSEY